MTLFDRAVKTLGFDLRPDENARARRIIRAMAFDDEGCAGLCDICDQDYCTGDMVKNALLLSIGDIP